MPPNQWQAGTENNGNGITIYRPVSLSSARTIPDKLLLQVAYISPAWIRAIKEVLADYRPDTIHLHDVWLGRSVFIAKGKERVVMDLHENMPAAVVQYVKGYRGIFKWFNAIFKNRARVARYEYALLRKCDLVFVVVEEAVRRVLGEYPQILASKVVSVENLESKEFLNAPENSEQLIDTRHFSVLYIGGFGAHRGIDTLIAAMQHIKAWKLNVRLHLVGARKGTYLDMLEELIERLDVGSHVRITGWVPSESVLAYIRQASVGAVPHHSNPHTDNTIPHKLYQYMIAATPVLVSTSPPLARTVLAARAGKIFRAGNELDCAEKIRDMYDNPASLEEYARHGQMYVVQSGHNWEEESAPTLIAAYDRLFGVGSPAYESSQSELVIN